MMDIETAGYERTNRSVFDRLGGRNYVKNQVCKYWLVGKCNRNPCRFLHSDVMNPQSQPGRSYDYSNNKSKSTWRNPNFTYKNGAVLSTGAVQSDVNNGCLSETKMDWTTEGSDPGSCQKAQQKQCQYWVTGNCVHGDRCKDLHSSFSGSGFSLLTNLEGHNKAVTGIALPSGSDKLFSASKDGCVCVWDCNNGQCVVTAKPGGEIGCLISEGPWVFAGLQNAVKAWNIETQTELLLSGPAGLVKAIDVGEDIVFAGDQVGSILAWKSNAESGSPELVAVLKGHKLAVLSLVVGDHRLRLYSGSKDETIRVWDIKTLQCLMTLNGHTNSVTSLICWESYLLSGSLDSTLKVWGATESGSLQVVYEVKEESGILALSGLEKNILLCSCKDNTVRLYDLPSFAQTGSIFARKEVEAIAIGCGGLFFTGDATGRLSVWKQLGTEEAMSS